MAWLCQCPEWHLSYPELTRELQFPLSLNSCYYLCLTEDLEPTCTDRPLLKERILGDRESPGGTCSCTFSCERLGLGGDTAKGEEISKMLGEPENRMPCGAGRSPQWNRFSGNRAPAKPWHCQVPSIPASTSTPRVLHASPGLSFLFR